MNKRASRSVAARRLRLSLGVAALAAGLLILTTSGIFSVGAAGQATGSGSIIRTISVTGVIDSLTADFVTRNIDQAETEQSRAIIIILDTPGGFDEQMREIIKKMSGSPLPVIVYVSPAGARAASAGTFIVMGADVAAMAPGTNLGAAHPVAFGVDPESTEGVKITNDAAAYIRSLAEISGRNANWAELAVRQSVSLTADEALEQRVIDLKSDDIDSLLAQLNGFHTAAKNIDINTEGAALVESTMSLRENILRIVLNPNVAYFLFIYGLLALVYEFVHPGIGFGAISGIISLVVSFYAMRILPVNLTGLALVIVGIALLGVDLYVTSHGALSAGGLIALIIGSFFLFEAPFLKVSLALNLAMAALTAGFFLIAARKVMKARRLPVVTGLQAMIGQVGKARSRLDPVGQVFVRGEIWSAEAPEGEIIEKGEEVEVTEVEGLTLKVKRTVLKPNLR